MRLSSRGLIIVKPARIVGQDVRVPFIVFGVMRGPSGTVLIVVGAAHSTVQCLNEFSISSSVSGARTVGADVDDEAFNCPYPACAASGPCPLHLLRTTIFRLIDAIESIARLGIMLRYFGAVLIMGVDGVRS